MDSLLPLSEIVLFLLSIAEIIEVMGGVVSTVHVKEAGLIFIPSVILRSYAECMSTITDIYSVSTYTGTKCPSIHTTFKSMDDRAVIIGSGECKRHRVRTSVTAIHYCSLIAISCKINLSV